MQFELNVSPPMARIDEPQIAAQPTLLGAINLCQTLSGKDDAHFYGPGRVVKQQAQWSRITGASDHKFPAEGLLPMMQLARNEAPFLWMAYALGYDINSLRKRETETEKLLRIERERANRAEAKVQYFEEVMTGRRSA